MSLKTNSPKDREKKIPKFSDKIIQLNNPFDSNPNSVTPNFSEVDSDFCWVWWKKKCQVVLHLKYDLLIAV